MLTKFSLLIGKISKRPAGVVDMDVGIIGLIQHRKVCWGNSLVATGRRIIFCWESGVGMVLGAQYFWP